MKILLTGANGQVAHEVTRRAATHFADVVALRRDELNICDPAAVERAMAGARPDAVVNAAAYTAVDRAEKEPQEAFAINRDGPRHLAEACARRRIPLLHLSTDYVFDGTQAEPYEHDAPANPQSVYGLSKWEGEVAVRETLAQHVIVRVSWVFGSHGHNFVRTMLRLGRERPELRIVADQRGGPTHAGHIADMLFAVLARLDVEPQIRLDNHSPLWGTFHFAGAPDTTWHDFARAIFEEAHWLGLLDRVPRVEPISADQYPLPARRPNNSTLDCSRLERIYHVSRPGWRQGLISVLNEWKLTCQNTSPAMSSSPAAPALSAATTSAMCSSQTSKPASSI